MSEDRVKEILTILVCSVLKLSDDVAINANDQCQLYEILSELEEERE